MAILYSSNIYNTDIMGGSVPWAQIELIILYCEVPSDSHRSNYPCIYILFSVALSIYYLQLISYAPTLCFII